jgi:hypothetical protein
MQSTKFDFLITSRLPRRHHVPQSNQVAVDEVVEYAAFDSGFAAPAHGSFWHLADIQASSGNVRFWG